MIVKKLFLLLLFLSTPAFAGEKAYDRVIGSGTLRCGYSIAPPVLMKDPNTGKLSGMDVDVWEGIARRLDMKIEWVESSGWGTFPEDLRSDKYDAYCSQIWINPARAKFLSLTLPITYAFTNTYVRPDDARFDGKDMEVFNSDTVTIPAIDGDITDHMARSRFPKAKVYTLPGASTVAEMYMAIITKKADVLFIDPSMYQAVADKNEIKLKKLNLPPAFTFGSRYSVAAGELQLRDMINVVLQAMIDDGTMEKTVHATSPDLVAPNRNYNPVKK